MPVPPAGTTPQPTATTLPVSCGGRAPRRRRRDTAVTGVSDGAGIVVFGGGLLGLGTARTLCRAGRQPVVVERASVGNERSGSKATARIFPLGQPDSRDVALARRAGGGPRSRRRAAGCWWTGAGS